MYELADVLSRRKFDRYVSLLDRKSFVQRWAEITPSLSPSSNSCANAEI
jgi:hypothetical protein